MSINVFDPLRKNGFLIEWRVSPSGGALVDALGAAQQHLQKLGGTAISVPQSCASNNQHATLLEFQLANNEELARVKAKLNEFATNRLPVIAAECASAGGGGGGSRAAAAASSSSKAQQAAAAAASVDGDDKSIPKSTAAVSTAPVSTAASSSSSRPFVSIEPKLHDFRGNVLYIAGKSQGDFLTRVWTELHALLKTTVKLANADRDLKIHLTLGRVERGAQGDSTLVSGLQQDPYWAANLADPRLIDVGTIVFCCKRCGNEPTPPVLSTLF
jgi:hypothetical protein